MKDELLKAILEILAIVAKDADVTETERDSVRDFLFENLPKGDIDQYLDFFDKATKHSQSNTLQQDKDEILGLCEKLNSELTELQRVIALVHLVELIVADDTITDTEDALLYFTGKCLKISKKIISLIKGFVTGKTVESLDSKHVLIVNGSEKNLYKAAKHLYYPQMEGCLAVLYVSIYKVYFIRHLDQTQTYLNGVYLEGDRVMPFLLGSVVKTRKYTLYHSDIVRYFTAEKMPDKIVFKVDKVSYEFKSGKLGLRSISLQEESGKLVAVMGGSGSGKSTLLNVLSGQQKASKGDITVNGLPISDQKVRDLVGYIPQADSLIEELTVFENLYYAALLCPGRASPADMRLDTEKLLKNLGLYGIRDLIVGSALSKVISGGQRKRLNVGLELIRRPNILFVDEPTSGLSSRDSENIMDILKELTLRGTLVFCVIHQPSSDILKMFDKLLILDIGGYSIYYGNAVNSINYFKSAAEHIDKEEGQCVACGNINAERIFGIIEAKIVDEFGKETTRRKILPPTWAENFQPLIKEPTQGKVGHTVLPKKRFYAASNFKQWAIFTKRDLKSKIGNKQYLVINILEPFVLAIILSYILRYSESFEKYVFYENVNISAYFLISIVVALFMGLTVSAEEIFKDKILLKRETLLNLNRNSYLYSKISILFTLSAIQTLIYVLVSSLILELHGVIFPYWIVLFSISCFSNLLGLNVSSTFNSVIAIYIIVPLLIIPQIILSGSVVPFDQLSRQISDKKNVPWIGEMMASRWAFEAILVQQFKENPYNKLLYPFDAQISTAEYYTTHWVPTLEQYLRESSSFIEEKKVKEAEKHLRLVRNEIHKQIKIYGKETFPVSWKDIRVEKFGPEMSQMCTDFVAVIKNIHISAHKRGLHEKEDFLLEVTNTPAKRAQLVASQKSYANEHIGRIVKNIFYSESIAVENDELIQLIFPIYAQPQPKHLLDCRTRMFFPHKYILGYLVPTLYFNLLAIWCMSILLYITLYHNVFRRMLGSSVHLFRRLLSRA